MLSTKSIRRGAVAVALSVAAMPILATASMATGPVAPATPTSVVLTSANRSLGVSWSESSTGIITFVATAKAAGKPTVKCITHYHNCHINSLINGVVYDVTVVASNAVGSSAPSADQTQTVGVATSPLYVHAVAGKAMATISWAPPIASGVSGITGYVATANPGGASCSTSGTLLNPPARTCQIAGLTSGTKYTVTVVATNAYGSGAPSKATTVTPL